VTDEAAPPESLPAEAAVPVKKSAQPHNPLHGLTLEAIVTALAVMHVARQYP